MGNAIVRRPLLIALAALMALAAALAYIAIGGSSSGGATDAPSSAPAERSNLIRLTRPRAANFSRRYALLQARVSGGAHDVRLQFRTSREQGWSEIPQARLSTTAGAAVSLPLATSARGDTALLRWDMPATQATDPGVSAANSIGRDGLIWVRAVATSADGTPLAGAPGGVALTRRGPTPADPDAPSIDDGVAFAGDAPIAVSWEASESALILPDGGVVDVPLAGYAVDVVHEHGPVPAARVTTRATSYRARVPPASDDPYVIVVRPIDVAGNVGEAHVTAEFVTTSLVLESPRDDQTVLRNNAVILRARSAGSPSVCFQYREADATVADGESPPAFIPIPPGEVTDDVGRPIGSWPVKTTGAGSIYRWHGLRHVPSVNGLPGRQVEMRVVGTGAGGACSAAGGASKPVIVTWSLPAKACNLDPATPDPNDECWGGSLSTG